MTDDIVERLRVWATWLDERCPDTDVRNDLRKATDEIERLRAMRDELLELTSRLMKERDQARRMYVFHKLCHRSARLPRLSSAQYAAQLGWHGCCTGALIDPAVDFADDARTMRRDSAAVEAPPHDAASGSSVPTLASLGGGAGNDASAAATGGGAC